MTTYGPKAALPAALLLFQTCTPLDAQTLTDIGPSDPPPGVNDIAQLSSAGNQLSPDGLNYYTDNAVNHPAVGEPGQTFVTTSNAQGSTITSLAIKTAGLGSDSAIGTPQDYYLHFYSISGSTATLLQSYTSGPVAFADGDWLQWSNLSVPLTANASYAYSFGRTSSGAGWEALGVSSGNPYAGGQIGIIPTNGGSITFGASHGFDAIFDLGITAPVAPAVTTPVVSPTNNPIFAGTMVTLSEAAAGQGPLHYQWQTDSGLGGLLGNIAGAVSDFWQVGTGTFAPGAYRYDVIVSNSFGAATSSIVTLTAVAASGPRLISDIAPNPAVGYVGAGLTFSATFAGTLPISYQWDFSSGGAVTNIPGATNSWLALSNLQFGNAGSYTLLASNSLGGPVGTSTADLVVLQAPAYPGAVLRDNPIGYWRLNETNSTAGGNLPAIDATGNFNGVYGSAAIDGVPGPNAGAGFSGFESSNTAAQFANGVGNSFVTIPALNLNTNTVTITAWIYPMAIPASYCGLVFCRPGSDAAGLNFTSAGQLGYTWNQNNSATWGWQSGLTPPLQQWSFVALVISPQRAVIYLCNASGAQFATNPIPHQAEAFNASTLIGDDVEDGGTGARTFGGAMDEVAVFNGALSPAQVLNLYYNGVATSLQATTPAVSPSAAVFAGATVTLSEAAFGVPPIAYQWESNGMALPGATSSTLVLTAVTAASSGNYSVMISNAVGTATSAPVALTVTLDTNPPAIVNAYSIGASNVELDFSKPLDPTSAGNLANYVFTDGLAITLASVSANDLSVILSTAPLTYGSNYTLVINGVMDQAVPPNTISANTLVNFNAAARQRVLLDSGWAFQLGDPADVTTNVTVYPEIPDLEKMEDSGANNEFTGPNSETNLQTLRPDPVATHAGENVSFVQSGFDDSGWRHLNLPHDWAVELPFDPTSDGGHGFKPVGYSGVAAYNIGWYRHTFTVPAAQAGKAMTLEFDGIYRNALIWLNGRCIGRDVSGYAPIYFDVTSNIIAGGTNVLVVRVDASRFEGWFYEGAGIYRHVWLTEANPVHVAQWGTDVATASVVGSQATVVVQTDITNQSQQSATGSLTSTILDANSNAVETITTNLAVPPNQDLVITQLVSWPANLWSPHTPYLYNLVSTVSNQGAVADIYSTPFGVRTVRFDATNGVLINGQRVEIQGMCNHQDHAGVGSALPDRLQYYRVERLKEMGCDAIRTSHNAPTPELLEACDKLGMLVLEETRRCGSDPESLGQLQRMVRRDRNHPSIFCWSMCNEEWWMQGDTNGNAVISAEQGMVDSLDRTRLCTAANNGGPYGGPTGITAVIQVQGFNYNLGSLDPFHASNPTAYVLGTEDCGQFTDRGIYTNDATDGYVSGYDLNNPGAAAEVWAPFFAARPWASGGFDWTGFDYRGEPTPYGWPCINSHFGSLDTCGFPKDNFYYYQANWTYKPVLHLFPHWNWQTPGQPINLWAFGNCQAVELFVNGVSQGRQTLNVQSHVEWDNVPYAPGSIQAIGYNNGVATFTNTLVTTGLPTSIALIPDRSTILANGSDVCVVTAEVLDAQGRVVPVASNLLNFTVTGGNILGVGNGDPSSHEPDKAAQRSLFSGLAQIIVQSTNLPGTINLTATSAGLTPTTLDITEAATLPPPQAPTGVAAVGGSSEVTISWDVVPGASTYNILRATSVSGPFTAIAGNVGSINLGYIDTNVTDLNTYYYVVAANGDYGNGTGPVSAVVSATPAALVTGLTASASNGQIFLNWIGSPGVNYNVERSIVTGGPYSIIASSVSGTNFTDTNVETCQPYFYVITITNGSYQSLPSAEAGAELPGVLPPQFTSVDVGSVALPGSASYCDGQFTISGSGSDIWGNSDAFQFVYTYVPVSTNCDIRARVDSIQNTSANAKGAVMIRETLAADSSHAMADVEPSAGIEFIWRNGTGSTAAGAAVNGTAPNWVRLTRSNDTFTAYWSPDGAAWTEIGTPTNISMAVGAYVGLAVCAHDNGVLATSMIDNVGANFMIAYPPPVLNPIGNQTVNVGQTVAFNAVATNAGSPPLTLIYNLLSGPAGATLNSSNGFFSWRPGVPSAGTMNAILLDVVNNAVPSLSATQNFLITVNPLVAPSFNSIVFSNGLLSFHLSGQTGPDYEVQSSTNLLDWSNLFITNSPAMPWVWIATNGATLPAQFFRTKTGPPLP